MENIEEWSAAKLASSLPYILSGSRFAHYIRVIGRDKIGKMSSTEQLEEYLNDWLYNYTVDIKEEVISKEKQKTIESPLASSEVSVTESMQKPGFYNINILLVPRFLSENLATKIEFVSEIRKGL
jgi:type VI secretion system protein ImpC